RHILMGARGYVEGVIVFRELRKDVPRHGETVVTGGHDVDAAVVLDGDGAERLVGGGERRNREHAARRAARAEPRDEDVLVVDAERRRGGLVSDVDGEV